MLEAIIESAPIIFFSVILGIIIGLIISKTLNNGNIDQYNGFCLGKELTYNTNFISKPPNDSSIYIRSIVCTDFNNKYYIYEQYKINDKYSYILKE